MTWKSWRIAALTPLLVATGVLAQPGTPNQTPTPCPWMGGMPIGQGMMTGQRPGPNMMAAPRMEQRVGERIAYLRKELGITPAQSKLFDVWAAVMQENARSMQAMHEQMMTGGMPATPRDRMAMMQAGMTAHMDAMYRAAPAFDRLYAALTPEQRQKADALICDPSGMM